MSFRVHAISPTDDRWEERDQRITKSAGRKADRIERGRERCEYSWAVAGFEDAVRMRKRLAEVEGVKATLQEAM